jgi:hypothetical protein
MSRRLSELCCVEAHLAASGRKFVSDDNKLARNSREQLRAARGNEYVVDDPSAQRLVPEKDRRLNTEDHPRPKRILAPTDHVDRLTPSWGKARSETIARSVNATMLKTSACDNALSGLVGDSRTNAIPDLCNTRVASASNHVRQF